MDELDLRVKIRLVAAYLRAIDIDPGQASPNLVASICHDYFPDWDLSGHEIVAISNGL